MGKRAADLTGNRYGRWTVLERNYEAQERRQTPISVWVCRCDCGTIKNEVLYNSLTRGGSQSCGCLKRELLLAEAREDHLAHRTENSLYSIWQGMKTRCFNPRHPTYARYGARGITVHPDWINDFEAFAAHLGPRPSPEHSVDRIDSDGHYEPGNVRWATRLEQARNRRPERAPQTKRSNIEGQRFGRWTVLHENRAFKETPESRIVTFRYWTCRCDCGTVHQAIKCRKLTSGASTSCGCEARERRNSSKLAPYFRRSSQNPLYRFWREKRQDPTFFCPEWHDDFTAFATEIGPQLPLHARLRRAYPDKPCAPENIVWSVPKSKPPPLPTTAPQKPRRRPLATYQEDPQRLYAKAKENNVPYAPLRRAANDPTDHRTLEQVIAALRADGLTFDHGYAKKA